MAAATGLVPRSVTGTGRTFAPIAGNDQWLRCSHEGTALDRRAEVVTLAEPEGERAVWPLDVVRPGPAGLAFDRRGCLYHGDPDEARLERVAWRPGDDAEPVDLLALPVPETGGQFRPAEPVPGLAVRPVALAVDPDDHLFVLDGGTGLLHVVDLADGRVLRTVEPTVPVVDLAADGAEILLATSDRSLPLLALTAHGAVRPVPLGHDATATLAAVPAAARPARVAAGPNGERWLLLLDGASAWAVPVADVRRVDALTGIDGATDIELDGEGRLVVAGPPGADLRRFDLGVDVDTTDVDLRARAADGRGIVRTPDGGIGYWRADRDGFRLALEGRRRHRRIGWVDGHRLDGGAYQRRWGRIFVEACVPDGAEVRVSFVTADDDPGPAEPEGPSIPRQLPANLVTDATPAPPAVPPLVATGRVPELAAEDRRRRLHRRETGSELPWARPAAGDRFEVYEAPVLAPPGRYLWVRLTLTGTGSVAPRVRAVRVEVPGHDLLERLPAAYRRDEEAASFLHRYLGIIDGLLVEAEGRSARRDLLLHPFGAPTEVLPWLASLVGLTLDGRWSERARRRMVEEAVCLFRRRGTIGGLARMLEIALDDVEVVIVETFRFRGTGGAVAGSEGSAGTVVGVDLRVGGELGAEGSSPLEGTVADAYATHVHRFTVLIPVDLDDERLAMVEHLLELHRPAHTIVEVCTVGRGMRVGVGLHLAVTTVVGPSAGFSRAILGETRLGTTAVLGVPRAGVRPGGSHLGTDTVVDP